MSNDDHFLDLTGDNVMPAMLEERESLKALIDNANHRLLELNNNIKDKLGDAQFASLPGWSIVYRSYKRREYVIKEAYLRPLYIKRAPDDE